MESKCFDIIIVGSGILAYSTALNLLNEDNALKIALVGPFQDSSSASLASGAMLGVFGEITKNLIATPWGQKKLKLGIQATECWPSWISQLNEGAKNNELLAIAKGTCILQNSRSSSLDDENYFAIKTALKQNNIKWETFQNKDLEFINPVEDSRPLEAIYIAQEGSIDSSRLLARLQALALKSNKINCFDRKVKRVGRKGNKISMVELDNGDHLQSSNILLAAGYATQKIIDTLPELAKSIPLILPGAGTSILMKPCNKKKFPPYVIRTPNRAFACGLHVVPRSNGQIYAGATNHVRLMPRIGPTLYDIHFLIECLMEQVNQSYYSATWSKAMIGHRPVSIDGFPLIGKTSIDGLWILTGTYRDGIHLSPLISKHIAKQILGTKAVLDYSFEPERKPIVSFTKDEAILESVKHHMAVGYEHAMRVPGGWHGQLESLFYEKIKYIYDEIDSEYILPPDFIPMIIESNNPKKEISFIKNYYQLLGNA